MVVVQSIKDLALFGEFKRAINLKPPSSGEKNT